MKFFLGTHVPRWLWDSRESRIPLFVSARTLRTVKRLHPALTDWALDSGGFTELTMYGTWRTPLERYVADARGWMRSIGRLLWAAPQDWMCEEFVCASTLLHEGRIAYDRAKFAALLAKVKPHKRTPAKVRECRVVACMPLPPKLWREQVREHQRRTVANYLALRAAAPDVPFAPVLQGFKLNDYRDCADLYRQSNIDLRSLPVVGVGSVCRRQHSEEAAAIVRAVSDMGIAAHGFGFKTEGIRIAGDALASADSLAWSYAGRMRKRPECRHGKDGKGNCANCPLYALEWFRDLTTRGTAAEEFLTPEIL